MYKRLLALAALLSCCRQDPAAAPGRAPGEQSAAVDPAGRLPDGVRPVSYQLELDVAPASAGFGGHVRIEVELASAVDAILLHAERLDISRAAVTLPARSGSLLAAPRVLAKSGLTALDLPERVGPGTVSLDLDFSGSYDAHLRGLYKLESLGDPYVFTQFEAIDARQAFPCFDEPRFKTPFDITLRVAEGQRAISNTAPTSERKLEGGLEELTFARTEPLPTYLIAFAVGPLDVVEAPPVPASDVRKQPLLGMERALVKPDTAWVDDQWAGPANADVDAWLKLWPAGELLHRVTTPKVRTTRTGDQIAASHGSFDNNLDVLTGTLERIRGGALVAPMEWLDY